MRGSASHSRSVSHLSEKEKLQYLQLTKTRDKIVEEYSRTTGFLDGQSFGTLPSSSSAKSRISKSSESKKKSSYGSQATDLPPLRSGIMMLPILATSGEPAMGSTSIGKKLKLPIFKLPQIDSKQFMAERMKLPSIITHADHSVTNLTFMTYFDKKSFKKAMLNAFRSMTANEKQFFAKFITASDNDVTEIVHEVERRLEHDNEPTFINGRKCIFEQSDLFKPDYHCPTVFMVACEAAAERTSGARSDHKKSTSATLAATANLNLTSLGISPEFNNFIGSSSAKLNDLKSLGGKSNARSRGTASRRVRRLPPTLNSTMGNPQSSLELTKMLIESMSKMDRHANMIRKGMEEAQEIVDSKDANVKVVIFTVGAERMQVALYRITLIDKKRGFYAWKHFVQLEHRQDILKKFFRFLVVRNLAIGVARLVTHVLKSNLVIWKRNADAESHRLLREKIERSAIRIQSIIRSRISYRKVNAIKQRRKYQKLYDATIKIQALMRGTVVKLRYQRSRVDRIQRNAATVIQRQIRGALARTKVQVLLAQYKRAMASKVVQRYVRGRQGRRRVKELQALRKMNKAAVLIQKIVRGFVDRRTMTAKVIARLRYKHAVKIQALARGFITRNNMERKLAELQAFRDHRNHAATQMQAAYRGFHARLLFKMKLYQLRKVKAEQFKAATSIITMVRGFLCRAELRHLKAERLEKWIADAREWQEMWSDESSAWFYLHSATGDALWEPNRTGYTKFDGSLVLASGEIIPDPLMAKQLAIEDGTLDEEAEAEASANTKKNNKLCSECADRTAIRSCNECGDKFCTKCYKSTHATGSRRNHTYTNIGPIDCAECELLLAGRWCVSCDEAYCNACWKKVHSHGKRRFHPYSEVSNAGRIDSRIFTMDGEQLDGYDTSYNQQRSELEKSTMHASHMLEYGSTASTAEVSNDLEWQEYTDDQGYPYWYNTITGASQYESPYSY